MVEVQSGMVANWHCKGYSVSLFILHPNAPSHLQPASVGFCRRRPNHVFRRHGFGIVCQPCFLPSRPSPSPSNEDAMNIRCGGAPRVFSATRCFISQVSRRLSTSCLLPLSVFIIIASLFADDYTAVPAFAADIIHHNSHYICSNVAHYYQGTSGLKARALMKKLHQIIANQQVVPYSQTWEALKVLDSADLLHPEASLDIIEIYTQRAVAKSLAGKKDGWNRKRNYFKFDMHFNDAYDQVQNFLTIEIAAVTGEHLWPRAYGLVRGTPEFSDLHNLRPADVNVNSARGKKYYGECKKDTKERCLIPANKEAAKDTATNRKIWMPPLKVRGDIARAIMYMAVRYGTADIDSASAFQLSDAPNTGLGHMGLLSVLLHWNVIDPPSLQEIVRNSKVCTAYQHNRNPFVDHPEYAKIIWGEPQMKEHLHHKD